MQARYILAYCYGARCNVLEYHLIKDLLFRREMHYLNEFIALRILGNNGSLLNPGKSCKNILLAVNGSSVSGTYWIKLGSSKAFQVYCDMKTHGGGWTLVYSYTFTNYNNFGSRSNAVTPRPNWPAKRANVLISTTPPLNESSLGAVNWSLWKNIGEDFMIKSNINDWLVCQRNIGSIVTQNDGEMLDLVFLCLLVFTVSMDTQDLTTQHTILVAEVVQINIRKESIIQADISTFVRVRPLTLRTYTQDITCSENRNIDKVL